MYKILTKVDVDCMIKLFVPIIKDLDSYKYF